MGTPRQRLTRATTRLVAALTLAWASGGILDPALLSAQEATSIGTVSGIVTAELARPLPAANVVLQNTGYGAVTGEDGRYTIRGVPAGTYTVRVQRIGYTPRTAQVTVTAGATASADFALDPLPAALTAQVVVGYTTQQRRDVSDATSTVNAEDVRDQSVATVEEALRGRVPGVQVNASGEPGRPAQIIIRGQNFLGNPTPLYVVDGMYLRENPNLNPDDIESIEVLKDASAAAQYGSQAANGVVVIRTRRGRPSDNNRIDVRSYYGMQDIPNRIDMMNATEWARLDSMAYANSGEAIPAGVTDALNGNPAANTDWQDAVFRSGVIQDHNLSISGGSANANYLISGGLLDQQGAVIETDFRRYSVRVNSEARRGRLTLGENIAVSRTNRQGLTSDFLTGFPLGQLVRMLPTIPVRDPNDPSQYGFGTGANETFGTNPVGLLEKRPITQRSNQVIGSAFGQVQLFENLRYRLNLGINYENFGRTEFSSITQIRMGSAPQFAELREIRNDFTSLLAENLLTYDDAFSNDAHRISAVAGYTEQTENADDISGYRRGFDDEALRTLNAGGEAGAANTGEARKTVLQSWLLRANYSLFNRYLLTGSIRRDGSSRFGSNNRWAVFSAFSGGWVVSEENFFRSTPVLNRASFLKLRASTGTLGNSDIGDYRYTVPLDQNRLGYRIGGQIEPGATQLQLANPNIKWQENRQTNFGLDLGLLGDRLSLTADAYRSTSTDLLIGVPLPWSTGIGEDPARRPVINAGSMRNTGTEWGLTYNFGARDSRDFRLTSTATLTTVRNKVLALATGVARLQDETGAALTVVGQPMGTFYLIRTAGIFQTPEEVLAHTSTVDGSLVVIQPEAQPGDIRYIDANGDGQITDDDRVPVGNGTPKYSYGMFFDGGWRDFDFGLNLRGAGGFKIFNTVRYSTDRLDDPSNHRKGYAPWTPENRSTSTPRALSEASQNSLFLTDRWLEDGSYLRIQNIVIGYTLPSRILDRIGITRAERTRVYLNMQNLHTFTDYTGWDPETLGHGNPLGRGVDDGGIYPNVRTVSFGVDLRL